jgi:serine/threonine-protein kinase
MKLVAPRAPTPVTPAPGRPGSSLPADIVADQIARLRLYCLVSGALWSVGLLMDVWLFPFVLGRTINPASVVVEALAIGTAVAVYGYVCYAPRSAADKADAGLWLMILNAVDIALLETWANSPLELSTVQPSWMTVIIMLTAMIMPSTPRKMALAIVVAASMGPLGIWIAYLRGVPVPPAAATVFIYLPNYLCGAAALVPSIVFHRMARRLREARDLGSYELIEQLGAGGMGEVWRARHRLLAREAAIKLVRPEVLGGGTGDEARTLLRRFEREAQATAQLSSPHSIRLFDFGATDDARFYYAMELLVGRDLASFVKAFGPMDADRAMYLLRQVCHSLDEAHERGLIHRDIKPANIYVCRMGQDYDFIKVLDFGLVKFNATPAAPDMPTQSVMTGTHTLMGTPAYMAPEVILGRNDVDRRADVYALGCVAYYMLTGEQVFAGDSPMQALVDHVAAEPSPPSRRARARIPAELDAIVMACLEKDPEKRPQDARTLRQRLETTRTCNAWSNVRAAEWWRTNLPDLAGPLTILREPAPVSGS